MCYRPIANSGSADFATTTAFKFCMKFSHCYSLLPRTAQKRLCNWKMRSGVTPREYLRSSQVSRASRSRLKCLMSNRVTDWDIKETDVFDTVVTGRISDGAGHCILMLNNCNKLLVIKVRVFNIISVLDLFVIF